MNQRPYQPHNLELQYQGYAETPLFWNDEVMGLKQFRITPHSCFSYEDEIAQKLRLGFKVERFVGSDLKNQEGIKVLAENIQIKGNKRTIGELDCLILDKGRPIHLEIIFKLYLYDEGLGTDEIDRWIGGNRRDSFVKKLNKLKKKQLPLLYHPNTKPLLKSLDLDIDDIEQRVHFRAQLFAPYRTEVNFNELNQNCLKGFYVRPDDLQRFSKNKFFIPYRHDWLIEPQRDAPWMDYNVFKKQIDKRMKHNSYPLCWIQYPDLSMEKFFVVWWD